MFDLIKQILITFVACGFGIIGLGLLLVIGTGIVVTILSPLLITVDWLDFNGYKEDVRTAKLPLSTIVPLLNDENIIKADKKSIRLKDGCFWNDSIYIKLNFVDYLKYQWYIRYKHRNTIKQANLNDTMAAINRLNAEYDRINQEVRKTIEKETENIRKIVETLKEVK